MIQLSTDGVNNMKYIHVPITISLIIVLIISIMVCIYFYKNNITNKFGFGEDIYQNECKKKYRHGAASIHYVGTIKGDNEYIKKTFDIVEKRSYNFVNRYFKKYNHPINLVVKESKKGSIYDYMDEEKPDPILFIYSYKEGKFLVSMDHIYVGGFFFQQWATYIFDAEQLSPISVNYLPIFTELLSLKFLIFESIPRLIYSRTDLNIFKNISEIQRFKLCLDKEELDNKYKGKTKINIIYVLSNILFKYLNIKRDLNILIPVALKNTPKIYNNVGGIILKISKKDTVDDIVNKIEKNKYHVSSTNHLMKIINKGKKVRQVIDAIMTIGYIKNAKLVTDNIVSHEVTYSGISEYGVYITSFTYNDKIHITFTVMTYNFDCKNFINHPGVSRAFIP